LLANVKVKLKKAQKKDRETDMSENDKLLDSILADENKMIEELLSPARLAEQEEMIQELLSPDRIAEQDRAIQELLDSIKQAQTTYLGGQVNRDPGQGGGCRSVNT
jgi:hypothetical protein